MRGEAPLLPIGETPDAREHILERLDSQQIVDVDFDPERPTGVAGVAFRLASSAVFMVWAMSTLGHRARWTFRLVWMDPQATLTRDQVATLRGDLPRTGSQHPVAERIVGQLIRRAHLERILTANHGERMEIEFTAGQGLRLEALPRFLAGPLSDVVADLDLQWYGPSRVIL